MSNKINIAVVGAAGYTGGELIRLLHHHPNAGILQLQSHSQAGKALESVHPDMIGTGLGLTDKLSGEEEVVFLCSGHGRSGEYLENHQGNARIIDLSHDHRLDPAFTYGLPEKNRDQISKSIQVANPGCFATAIQLALLPAVSSGISSDEIHVSAVTGSTGAGFNRQKPRISPGAATTSPPTRSSGISTWLRSNKP